MSNNIDEEKKEFTDAEQNEAYLELCYIIRTVIENGDFASLEPRIALWENKYPLAKFTNPEILRKIKAILNKDYLSRLLGDYLASQVLHEQQRQKEFYDKLKNIINTAKKTKDYKTANKEIANWKNDLHSYGFSIYDFNKQDLKNVLRMLNLPNQELSEQSNAFKSLDAILKSADKLDSKELLEELENWNQDYPLNTFPNKLKRDLEEVFIGLNKEVLKKETEENAIQKLQNYLSSNDKPAEDIPKLLAEFDLSSFSDQTKAIITTLSFEAMSLQDLVYEGNSTVDNEVSHNNIPKYQENALNELKNLFEKSKNNYEDIFTWIYLNRATSFVPEAIDDIKQMFIDAGYPVPKNGEYHIPSSVEDVTAKNVQNTMKQVVLNYIGLLYTKGDVLSSTDQNKIKETYYEQASYKQTATIVIPVSDNSDTIIESAHADDSPDDNIKDYKISQEGTNGKSVATPNTIGNTKNSENFDDEIEPPVLVIDELLDDPSATTYELLPIKSEQNTSTKIVSEPNNPEQESQPEVALEPEPEIKEEVELEVTPETEPETKEEVELEVTPEPEPEIKEEVELEVTPETEPEIKEEVELEATPETEPETKEEIELEVTPETEPEIKEEVEIEVTPEPEPEIKEEVELEVTPEPEPEIKAQEKPEAIQNSQVEPNIETEVEYEPKSEHSIEAELKNENVQKTSLNNILSAEDQNAINNINYIISNFSILNSFKTKGQKYLAKGDKIKE